MGAVVILSMRTWMRGLCLLALAPALAFAQAAAQPSSEPAAQPSVETAGGASRVWIVAGGAFATLRGDCQTCEEDFPYRHSGAVLVDAGYRVNDRMDVGAEVYWMPIETAQGTIRTTHIDGVAQFRPWPSQGFFLKGGAGMAFVRNWVDALGPDSFNDKGLSVTIGAGWAVRPAARVGLQVFVMQHAVALGDLQASESLIPDVIGNRWSVGAAVVIR
jgi:Outer membrane protein beta-barrel domain